MNKSRKVTLPAGQYWLGDLCYVIGRKDRDWMYFLENSFWKVANDNQAGGAIEYKGHKGFAAYTAHGDGRYFDGEYEYGVDAGMIGIIPIAASEEDEERMMRLGRCVEFKSDFICYRDEEGTFFIGDIEIPTDWDAPSRCYEDDEDDE